QQVLGASAHNSGELLGAFCCTAPDPTLCAHVGAAVAYAKPLAQTPLGARAIVINRQIDALGDRESSRVALCFVQETPQRAVLLDKIRRRRRTCAHPAVAMVHGTPESRGLTCSEPDGRVWLL